MHLIPVAWRQCGAMRFCPLSFHGQIQPAFLSGATLRSPLPLAPAHQSLRRPVHSRARQRRFALPPVVPATRSARLRAIELLGHATQRREGLLKPELISLIGKLPPDRRSAQLWKAGLQRLARNAHPQKSVSASVNAVLPKKDADLGRVFSVLDVVRRRLSSGRALPASTVAELQRHVGVAPRSELETHRLSRALVLQQRQRRCAERRPPRLPTEIASLREANMLLGNLVYRGRIGGKTERLNELLGGLPRTVNVARSWKKIVAGAVRKNLRKTRVQARRREIEIKRERRRLKRMHRDTVDGRTDVGVEVECEEAGVTRAVRMHAVRRLWHAMDMVGRHMRIWIRRNMGKVVDEGDYVVGELSNSSKRTR